MNDISDIFPVVRDRAFAKAASAHHDRSRHPASISEVRDWEELHALIERDLDLELAKPFHHLEGQSFVNFLPALILHCLKWDFEPDLVLSLVLSSLSPSVATHPSIPDPLATPFFANISALTHPQVSYLNTFVQTAYRKTNRGTSDEDRANLAFWDEFERSHPVVPSMKRIESNSFPRQP